MPVTFPLAYAIILPALYAPLIAMLLGLVLRGVAFEFRWRDPAHRALWDRAFTGGSAVATFAQAVALGALLQGISVQGRAYSGGWWEWLSPFSLLTGVALMVGYALLGACWLNWKTQGGLQRQAVTYAGRLGIALLILIGAVSPSSRRWHCSTCACWGWAYRSDPMSPLRASPSGKPQPPIAANCSCWSAARCWCR